MDLSQFRNLSPSSPPPHLENPSVDGLWLQKTELWRDSLTAGLASNAEHIRSGDLSDGWKVTYERAEIISAVLKDFFSSVLDEYPPSGSAAVYTLGGTGRFELCPDSDIDLLIFVENIDDNEAFLEHVATRRRLLKTLIPQLGDNLNTNSFVDLRNRNHFDLIMLRSMLDASLIAGDDGFHSRIQKQCREQSAALNLELVFDTIDQLRTLDKKHPQEPGNIGEFNIKEGRGGMRNFHLPIWMLGFEHWRSCRTIYELGKTGLPGAPSSEVQDAAGILLMARSWLALENQHGASASQKAQRPILDEQGMHAFSSRFGARGVRQLNDARETLLHFREDAIDHLLETGVVVPGSAGFIRYGLNGLSLSQDAQFADASTKFFQLFQAAREYDIPIARSTLRVLRQYAAHTVGPHPLFLKNLSVSAPIGETLRQWKSFGVLPRLLPEFEVMAQSFYSPEHRNSSLMKDARAIQRIENLDRLFEERTQQSSANHQFFRDQINFIGDGSLAAVRLALLTEEVPDTVYEGGERYELSVARYIARLEEMPGMDAETLDLTRFLLQYKRRILSSAEQSSDPRVLKSWSADIDALSMENKADAARAIALFVYAAFDFAPVDQRQQGRLSDCQWRNLCTLSENLIHIAEGVSGDSFLPEYFDDIGRRIGAALPDSLKQGPMLTKMVKRFGEYEWDAKRAHPIIENLVRVLKTGEPRMQFAHHNGEAELALFGFNQPGQFWKIASVLREMNVRIHFTELYPLRSAPPFADDQAEAIGQLVVDYITFGVSKEQLEDNFPERLRASITERLNQQSSTIPDDTPAILAAAPASIEPRLTDLGNGKLKFSFRSPEQYHLLYAVSRNLSEQVRADITSVSEDGTHDWDTTRINVYFRSPHSPMQVHLRLQEIFGSFELITGADAERFQNGSPDHQMH